MLIVASKVVSIMCALRRPKLVQTKGGEDHADAKPSVRCRTDAMSDRSVGDAGMRSLSP